MGLYLNCKIGYCMTKYRIIKIQYGKKHTEYIPQKRKSFLGIPYWSNFMEYTPYSDGSYDLLCDAELAIENDMIEPTKQVIKEYN